MSLVRPVCAACGEKTEMLAIVTDPFSDSSYGLCRACIGQTYPAQNARLRESLAREALRAEPAEGEIPPPNLCPNCGWDASFHPPEITRCIACGTPLRAEPAKEEA